MENKHRWLPHYIAAERLSRSKDLSNRINYFYTFLLTCMAKRRKKNKNIIRSPYFNFLSRSRCFSSRHWSSTSSCSIRFFFQPTETAIRDWATRPKQIKINSLKLLVWNNKNQKWSFSFVFFYCKLLRVRWYNGLKLPFLTKLEKHFTLLVIKWLES